MNLNSGDKVITPDGYVAYYRTHSKYIVWLSQYLTGSKMFPYPIKPGELEKWPRTNEKPNINEKYGV